MRGQEKVEDKSRRECGEQEEEEEIKTKKKIARKQENKNQNQRGGVGNTKQ